MPVGRRWSAGLVTLPPRAFSRAPKLQRERHLLLVGQLLAAEHQHGKFVHAGFDGRDVGLRERLGDVDAGDLAGERGLNGADGDRHGRPPEPFGPLWRSLVPEA